MERNDSWSVEFRRNKQTPHCGGPAVVALSDNANAARHTRLRELNSAGNAQMAEPYCRSPIWWQIQNQEARFSIRV